MSLELSRLINEEPFGERALLHGEERGRLAVQCLEQRRLWWRGVAERCTVRGMRVCRDTGRVGALCEPSVKLFVLVACMCTTLICRVGYNGRRGGGRRRVASAVASA